MDCLFQGIQHKTSSSCAADPPTDDPAGKHVNDKGDVDDPLPSRDIGKVADPKHVWCRRMELPVHPIQWARPRFVRYGRSWLLSANDPLNADVFYQSGDCASCNILRMP